MQLSRALVAAAALAVGTAALVSTPSQAEEAHTAVDGHIVSVPDLGSTEPVEIHYTLFKPAGASAANPVPLIFHSHGWGGSRTTSIDSFDGWLDAGYGVLSFDQRGFGESGGKAHVEHPDVEGFDVEGLVDVVAAQDWVLEDGPGDPRIGAIGGSYGGGYQFVGALGELYHHGSTRFDALAPEITWWDLKESLAPSEVARSTWIVALYAAGAEAHTNTVHQGFAYGATTGDWPKGQHGVAADLDAFFQKNGPSWHAGQGRALDIPVLFGQGLTDNLFNLNQAVKNFEHILTDGARAQSLFVGYNGGHALPNVLPAGVGLGGDPCSVALGSPSFSDLARRFMDEHLKGLDRGLTGHGAYHLATVDGACVTVESVDADTPVPVGTIAATTGLAGPPVHTKVADGPISIAGVPTVDAVLTSASLDTRVFLALSVGTTPADARVIQQNVMPLRQAGPVLGEAVSVELAGVAADVPEGQSLFLTVSPVSDMFASHGSRSPSPVLLEQTTVHLPVVD